MYFLFSSTRSLGFMLVYRVVEEFELAGPGAVQHAQDAQQGGFAGSRWTHDGDELAFLNLPLDAAQHVGAAVSPFVKLVQVRQFNHVYFHFTGYGQE